MMAESRYGVENNNRCLNHKILKTKKKQMVKGKNFSSGFVDRQHQQVHWQVVATVQLPSLHVPLRHQTQYATLEDDDRVHPTSVGI